MALDTNLSRSPYFDTFNTDSGYHQILFRPAVAVQTRELNELQSIQQDQISKFGRQIFTEGSVVEGCQLSFESNIPYVKIIDEYANGTVFGNVNEFLGLTVKNGANVSAIILNTYPGSIGKTASGDLNTLYVRYTQASDTIDQKYFVPGEQLTLYTASGNPLGNLVVANTTITGPTPAIGFGYIVHAQEGVIFQKGFFTRAQPQSYILSKYSSYPDKLSIGYTTIETIDTPESNTNLLDNASGAPNYSAPGAHRLKLTPILTSRETQDVTSTSSFFSIADFTEGAPSVIRTDPSFSSLGKQLAKRTFDESGNYIINPFVIRLGTKYDANNDIVADQLKLEIEKGLAYVNGYRIETVGKLINSVRRGTDTKQVPQQTVTSTMGSYVFVKEFAGVFQPTSFQKVSLRSLPTNAISDRDAGTTVNSWTPRGAEIGTANILGIEYDNGAPGTSSCVYRVYLTNINCKDFSQVKSLYVTDGDIKEGFADTELVGDKNVLRDANLQTLTFPYNQKAIKTLYGNSDEYVSAQFDYKANTNITISSAGQGTITVASPAGGINKFPYSENKNLSDILERDFIITFVGTTAISAANIAGSVSCPSGCNIVTGVGTTFLTEFANGNIIRFSNNYSISPKNSVTDFKYARIASVDSNVKLTLANNTTWDYGAANVGLQLFYGEQIGSSMLPNTSIKIETGQTSATLKFGHRNFYTVSGSTFTAASFPVEVLYNVRRTKAKPILKKLNDFVVKIDTSENIKKNMGPWCLGFPDVYRIKNVYVSDDYSTTSSTDRTSSFLLDNGQRDAFYDLAYISRKSGFSIAPGKKIVVKLEAFVPDYSNGRGFYSIDSYPIDDTGITANTILTQNVPIYKSYTSGNYDLRNTIDFRVISSSTATATNVVGDASIDPPIPSDTPFSTSSLGFVPVPETSFESDLEYYVGRYDKVGLDSFGNIKIAEGAPDENPVPPPDIPSMMTLALLTIPPFPSLSPAEARVSGRSDLITSITYYKNKRYTMKDISSLDKRIENLEYYTSLSSLELSTKNLLIKNEADNNRFQYGLLVDSFRGHDIGSTTDPQYRIAIDYENNQAQPMVEEIRVDLKYVPSFGATVSNNDRLITLYYDRNTEHPYYRVDNYISQLFASKYRNCSQDVTYVYDGHITLRPEGDWTPSVTTNPDININLDLYTNLTTIADAVGTMIGQYKETNKEVIKGDAKSTTIGDFTTTVNGQGGTMLTTAIQQTITTKSTQTATTTRISSSDAVNTTYNLGEVVNRVALMPFMREKVVNFSATGMKPNAILYAYLDDIDVSQYCLPAVLKVDSDGKISGTFTIPRDTFYAGERVFKLVDVNNLVEGTDYIQTQASAIYFGTNLAYAKENVTLNTTTGQLAKVTGSDTKVVTTVQTDTTFEQRFTPFPPPPRDPIMQTFGVNESEDLAGIYVDSVDLYFFKKDLARGIRIDIREMYNGYPGFNVLPFSSVHLDPINVKVSSDSSVATRFIFDAPVFLQNKTDYALAIMADGSSPDYAIWTAELGGIDVKTRAPIFKNSDIGVMFTSSDNKTWVPYQKEDIKFGFTRINFVAGNQDNINVKFTNDDTEYVSANDLVGTFDVNEKVYFSNATIFPATVTAGSLIINIPEESNHDIAKDSWIYVRSQDGANTNIRKVTANTLTSITIEGALQFYPEGGAATVSKLSGNGNFYGFLKTVNYSNGYIMIGNSTANSSVYLTEDHYILSATSQASATIKTLNDVKYNELMPKFAISTPPLTSIDFSVSGISNNKSGSYISDSNYYNLIFAQPTTFFDKERIVMSRSNEIRFNSNNKTLSVNAKFASTNTKLTPVIDQIKTGVITTYNIINEDTANDYNQALTIQYNHANCTFNVGDQIRLFEAGEASSTKTANVIYSYTTNSSHGTIIVNYIGGSEVDASPSDFTVGANILNYTVSLTTEPAGNVGATMRYVNNSLSILATEKTPGSGTAKARYISKKVVLADGQDAEDIKVYVAAYKPAGTDIYVFAKFWNAYDPEPFDSKAWTQLTTDNTLVSSKTNLDDFIEYEYGLKIGQPTRIAITANTLGFSNTDNYIVVNNIANSIFTVGDRIYYEVPNGLTAIDGLNANTYHFVVAANNTSIKLSATPGGSALDIVDARESPIGEIHYFRDEKATDYTAFLNSENNNFLRYFNRDGSIFDTYKAYSIKIVLLSSDSSIIPKIQDYRAIAVTAF